MKKQILLSILFVAVLGCAENKSDDVAPPAVPEPIQKTENFEDEASAQERNLVVEIMQSIQGYAAEFGVDTDLNRIPIVLTTRKELPRNTPSTCIVEDGKGAKIVLQKSFFTTRVFDNDTGLASPLFNLLVHEIGHCYQMRQHEQSILRKPGHHVEFVIRTSKGSQIASYPSIQTTMMHNTYFAMPKALEKYYVGEIFGKFRAKSLEELQSHYDFKIVRDTEGTRRPR